MRRIGLVRVFACGALVMLGACSDYDPAKMTYVPPAPSEPEQPGPGPVDPGTVEPGPNEDGAQGVFRSARDSYELAVGSLEAGTGEIDDVRNAFSLLKVVYENLVDSSAIADIMDEVRAFAEDSQAEYDREVASVDAAQTALDGASGDTAAEQAALDAAKAALRVSYSALADSYADRVELGDSVDVEAFAMIADTEYDRAVADVAAAQAAVDGASAGDMDAMDAAQAALEAAQMALNESSAFLTELQSELVGIRDVRIALDFASVAAAGDTQEVALVRTDRTDMPGVVDDDTSANAEQGAILTDIATAAVPYAAGKALSFPGSVVSDEFPLRGVIARGNNALDEDSLSSIQLGLNGVTINLGGDGSKYSDSRLNLGIRECRQTASPCEDDNDRVDLAIGLGSPKADPANDKIFYWETTVPFPENTPRDEMDRARTVSWSGAVTFVGRPNVGTYETWLSNFAGVDDNDEDIYLAYAAYGLFHFMDNTLDQGGPNNPENTNIFGEASHGDSGPRTGRRHAFHFGLDAFDGGSGTSAADGMTVGTYNGKTEALYQVYTNTTTLNLAPVRLQGDVALTVADSGGLKISGTISGIESHDGSAWSSYASLEEVELVEGDIAADGSYTGTANMTTGTGAWEGGEYGGSFYGPADSPETAGQWAIHIGTAVNSQRIVGAFGAAKAPAP